MATRKRITKALILRICAVGLFICLGAFAVMHSIYKQKDTSDELADKAGETTPVTVADQVPVVDPGPTNKVAMVSGTDELNPVDSFSRNNGESGFDPATNRSSISSPSNTRDQFSGSSSLKSANNSNRIPPFDPYRSKNKPSFPGADSTTANSTGDEPNSESSGFPPFRQSSNSLPARNASANITNSLVQSAPASSGEFSANGTTPETNTMLPPFRTQESRIKDSNNPPGFASNQESTTAPKQLPPIRSTFSPIAAGSAGAATLPIRPSMSSPTESLSNTGVGFDGANSQLGDNTNKKPTNLPSTMPPGQSQSIAGSTGSPGLPPMRPQSTSNSPATINPGFSASKTQSPSTHSTFSSGTTRSVLAAGSQNVNALASSMATSAPSGNSRAIPGERRLEGVQIPALAVQKIVPREIQVNRETTFELIVKNTGQATADNVQVHDFVPEGTRLLETMPPANAGPNGRITWNLGSLAPGQQSSIKMKLLPQRTGNIGSVAHVTFGALASAQTVCTQPKLSIRHEAPSTVLLGQNLVMTIFVENTGNGAAENVVLQEDVPEGLIFAGGQQELEYTIGTLPPGQTRRIQLPLRAAKVGLARNVLVAHGEGSLQTTDTVDIRVIAPKLILRTEGPSQKFMNRTAIHTFSLANQGSAAATNVQMVARLPRGLQFVSANNQGQYDRTNHVVVWRLAKLDAQKTGSVELTTLPIATGQLDINVIAAADLNQRQESKHSMVVKQISELYFDIDDTADAIEIGTSTTFRVRIVNQGKIASTNVLVQVEFSSAMQPESVQGGVRHQIRGQTVVLDAIPSMQPGQEISFTVTAKAIQAGDHRTVVSVRSDDRDIAVSKEESTHVYSDR